MEPERLCPALLLRLGLLGSQQLFAYLSTAPFVPAGDIGAALKGLAAPAWANWVCLVVGTVGTYLNGSIATRRLISVTDPGTPLGPQMRHLGLFAWILRFALDMVLSIGSFDASEDRLSASGLSSVRSVRSATSSSNSASRSLSPSGSISLRTSPSVKAMFQCACALAEQIPQVDEDRANPSKSPRSRRDRDESTLLGSNHKPVTDSGRTSQGDSASRNGSNHDHSCRYQQRSGKDVQCALAGWAVGDGDGIGVPVSTRSTVPASVLPDYLCGCPTEKRPRPRSSSDGATCRRCWTPSAARDIAWSALRSVERLWTKGS